MHHDGFGNADLGRVISAPVGTHDRVGEKRRHHAIAKGHHFTCFCIHLWVCGEVVGQCAVKVVFPICAQFRQIDAVRRAAFHHGKKLALVKNHGGVASVLA